MENSFRKASKHIVNLSGSENINKLREELGWSMNKLAKKANVGVSALWNFCYGFHHKQNTISNKRKVEMSLSKNTNRLKTR